jgi:hypothetical protein
MNSESYFEPIMARWALGLIRSDELPDIAAGALSNVFESTSLLALAGRSQGETDEARKLFERALNELGHGVMSKTDALRIYAKITSTSILASEFTPLEGANRIWRAKRDSGVTGFHDLDPFIYAASEMEDRPEDKEFFERAIIEEAKRWAIQTA